MERIAQAVIDEFEDLCLAIAGESQRPRARDRRARAAPRRRLPQLARRAHAQQLLGAHRFALPRALHPLTRASAGHAPVGVVGITGAPERALRRSPSRSVGTALLAGNGAILAPAADALVAGRADRRRRRPRRYPRRASSALGATGSRLPSVARPFRRAWRGPDAMLVLADAQLRHAVDGALWGACAGSGRLAGSVKRVFIAREHSGGVRRGTRARGADARARATPCSRPRRWRRSRTRPRRSPPRSTRRSRSARRCTPVLPPRAAPRDPHRPPPRPASGSRASVSPAP